MTIPDQEVSTWAGSDAHARRLAFDEMRRRGFDPLKALKVTRSRADGYDSRGYAYFTVVVRCIR